MASPIAVSGGLFLCYLQGIYRHSPSAASRIAIIFPITIASKSGEISGAILGRGGAMAMSVAICGIADYNTTMHAPHGEP
jgi:hypothetical protein